MFVRIPVLADVRAIIANDSQFTRITAFETVRAEDRHPAELFDFKLSNMDRLNLRDHILARSAKSPKLSDAELLDYSTYIPAPPGVASRVQVHPVWVFQVL